MGTRNLTVVILDGKPKVAQYGQWDGYPGGQGDTVVGFLLSMDREKFTAALRECRFVTQEEIEAAYEAAGAEKGADWVSAAVATEVYRQHPEWNRDVAAGILSMIQDGNARNLKDSFSFAADSLFCEWAYVVDLDTDTLEVYKGFNKTPLDPSERFAGMKGEKEYHPIALLEKYPISRLTKNTMGELEHYLDKKASMEDEGYLKALSHPTKTGTEGA